MDIYIVQPGDTIYSIADKYGVPANRLIYDNGIENPSSIVPGQTIVIAYPSRTHIVRERDTLTSISRSYGISLMQLLRNNSFLSDREYIFPGETLVISYNTTDQITTNGYAYPFINRNTLIKTLPYLTYLSIFNYRITEEAEIISYNNDSELVQLSRAYGVIPLLMTSVLSPQGEPDIELVYEILLNEEFQNLLINNLLSILRSTAYSGANIMLSRINETNQNLYMALLSKISSSLKNEGYQLFLTINPGMKSDDDNVTFEQLDYSGLSEIVDGITFLQYVWGTYSGPPAPVSSIHLLRPFIEYVISLAPPKKFSVGEPLIGYNWELPYVPGKTNAFSITINSALSLASDTNAAIQFDEVSQTPFFTYILSYSGAPIEHIVWFIDARSIDALDDLIIEYGMAGSGIWNIMIFYQQMWTLIISNFEIIKYLPDS